MIITTCIIITQCLSKKTFLVVVATPTANSRALDMGNHFKVRVRGQTHCEET